MLVYPVNALEAATLQCDNVALYSLITDIHNRYIEYQVDFNSNTVTINGTWSDFVEINAFIIGNTNATSGTLKLLSNNTVKLTQNFQVDEYIKIIGMRANQRINKFTLSLSATENISIGLLYIGEAWELPRFIVQPKYGLQLRNETDRSFSGQVIGVPTEPLNKFSVEYQRIDNKTIKLFERYINGVQTVIPHVIDPYPEAHDQFAPFFATVSNYGERTKRKENGFYWNYAISWQEAK